MVDAGKILLQALISEKATTLQEQANCYVFRVANDSQQASDQASGRKGFQCQGQKRIYYQYHGQE